MTSTHRRHREYMPDQRRFFDDLVTADWDAYQDPAWDRSRDYELAQLFKIVQARRIVDVGCGVGYHDLVMVERFGASEVLGVDYSEKSIAVAERVYPHERITRRSADVFELPPAEYDLAVSFQVIEHLQNPIEFLEALRGQVRDGGWVAVLTPNRLRLNNRIRALRGREAELSDPQHHREYTHTELCKMGLSAGLTPTNHFGYGLSLIAPKIGREVVPARAGLRLGNVVPAWATVICQIYRSLDGE